MNISDQDVQAYVDGELDAAAAARIEAAIAADVLIAARVERERRLRAQLRGAFDPVLEEPVPSRLTDLLAASRGSRGDDTSNVYAIGARSASKPAPRWRVPAFAMAASVAAIALSMWWRAPRDDIGTQHGALVAQGALAHALDTALASAPDAASPVRIGLTFRDADGRICRTYVSESAASAGLACRANGAWQLEAIAHATGPAGEVRQAASSVPPEIQAAVDARMRGDVFDAAQERQALADGWR